MYSRDVRSSDLKIAAVLERETDESNKDISGGFVPIRWRIRILVCWGSER